MNVDIVDQVRDIVGPLGVVKSRYGGLEVQVKESESFPWSQVLGAILDVGQDLWLKRSDGHMFIHSKPPGV